MTRQMVILGTASQAPTRTRNHNGYLLRWDALGVLFDPGEGVQRQLLLAGERSSAITHVAITHRHGDHLLGLPGLLQRMVLDQRRDPVVLVHPADATGAVDHLLALVHADPPLPLIRHALPDDVATELPLEDPLAEPRPVVPGRPPGDLVLRAVPLDHRVPTLGYRVEEPPGLRVDPARLADAGLAGPVVGQLLRDGAVVHGGRQVRAEEVTVPRPGQAAAFVMDTRSCAAVDELLAGADLAVVESTFQDGDEDLAQRFAHLTAGQAGRHAAAAGVRRLVLSHFSQRYGDPEPFGAQARVHHDDVHVAEDLDRVDVPSRVAAPAR